MLSIYAAEVDGRFHHHVDGIESLLANRAASRTEQAMVDRFFL